MPELPEVETTVRALRQQIVGQTIVGVDNDWERHIATPSPVELSRRILGRTINSIDRRGKYLVFNLEDREYLIIHLKMSGRLLVEASGGQPGKHVHTTFMLASGYELRFSDVRKFGKVYLVKDPDLILGKLGPEPLSDEFTPDLFGSMLATRKRTLKPLLLDQTFIAGIGNIYADEALHHARLLPTRKSNSLDTEEIHRLHRGIRRALLEGIRRGGATIDDYRRPDGSSGLMQESLVAYGREGAPCRRCGESITRIVLGGRSTFFCSGCQR